jgi:methionyl-tRNA formyltransferase
MNKRIVCWVGEAPNHRALVAKIAATYNVAGVVVDRKKELRIPGGFMAVWKKIIHKIRFAEIDTAWSQLQEYYGHQFPEWPPVPVLFTDSINSTEVVDFTSQLQPDLVIVSGTSLIKEPLVSLPLPVGIMNLHTGLSPYVKGGPNCTNCCIANNEWELIGNSIMWLSAGIDSGNIITSERTDLGAAKELPAIHLKVMEHAHDLYLRAIGYIVSSSTPYPSVPQASLGKGNLYLTKMWTAEKKSQLLKNLRKRRVTSTLTGVKTVALP